MKKLYVGICVAMLITQLSYAQWTTTGTTTATSNSVGIGTGNPQSNLEINNGSYSNGNQLIISGGESTRYYGVMEATMPAGHTLFSLGTKSNFANYFQTLNLVNGNIGIGTTNPAYRLQVNTGTDQNLQIRPYTFGSSGIFLNAANDANNASIPMEFGASNFSFNIGNVGIGTASPSAKLQVVGTMITGGSGSNLDGQNLSYLANSNQMLVGWNRSRGAGETDFISNQGPGGTGGFAFYNYDNSGTESLAMYIRGNGQLTIGNCNPYSYKLAVGGSMIAESVTVKLLASWPDYVFKPTYHLTPLSEIKIYIDQNHHLPDMPSEKEVAEKGLDLGEMNKLLTKKVEELTLYLIDKDKQLNEQQLKLRDQAVFIQKMEKRIEALETNK